MKNRRNGRKRRTINQLHHDDGSRKAAVSDQRWNHVRERAVCPLPHKHSYLDRKEAKAVLRKVRHNSDGRLHVYKCSCGRFHIGTASLKPGPAPELA